MPANCVAMLIYFYELKCRRQERNCSKAMWSAGLQTKGFRSGRFLRETWFLKYHVIWAQFVRAKDSVGRKQLLNDNGNNKLAEQKLQFGQISSGFLVSVR
jgi:hypothetical protein